MTPSGGALTALLATSCNFILSREIRRKEKLLVFYLPVGYSQTTRSHRRDAQARPDSASAGAQCGSSHTLSPARGHAKHVHRQLAREARSFCHSRSLFKIACIGSGCSPHAPASAVFSSTSWFACPRLARGFFSARAIMPPKPCGPSANKASALQTDSLSRSPLRM